MTARALWLHPSRPSLALPDGPAAILADPGRFGLTRRGVQRRPAEGETAHSQRILLAALRRGWIWISRGSSPSSAHCWHVTRRAAQAILQEAVRDGSIEVVEHLSGRRTLVVPGATVSRDDGYFCYLNLRAVGFGRPAPRRRRGGGR